MAFHALPASPDLADQIDRLRQLLRQPDYSANPGQVFDNLDADPQIPDQSAGPQGSRQGLLDALPGDPSTARVAGRDYSRAHQREGSPAPSGLVLGHVRELDRLVTALYHPGVGLTRAQIRSELLDLMRARPAATALADQSRRLAFERLSSYQMWSFYCDHGELPPGPMALRRSQVIDRLGLGHLQTTTDVLVFFTHRLPGGVKAHRPTAWDGELANPCWRPTGRSEPLSGGGSARGFPEVVHLPIRGSDLESPMVEIAS